MSSFHFAGSEGRDLCYPDSELAHQGHEAGDCICRPGFAGPRCDRCAPGYTGYPRCVPCPCSLAGTQGGQCTGECRCKRHATGPRCDRCKSGYFALLAANPDGCTECFCYGVTSVCESANFGVEMIDLAAGWQVTDLSGKVRVNPYWSSVTSGLTIAQEDIGLDTYYWEAPEAYIGNKLVSYGQQMTVHTVWHAGRGDTSGTPTREPDVILESIDGMRIGFGSSDYRGSKNATIQLVFLEHSWYYLDGERSSVGKHEFMRCLGSLRRLLIRAKYHSDQLEGTLLTAAMEFGAEGSLSAVRTAAVERCSCPPGYTGLSCEACAYGYTRVNGTLYRGECRKCACNGHAATCDPVTLECGACEHNTVGRQCESCAAGFYGNARLGRPNDCRPCKCPLDLPSNNFSPTCQVATIDYDKYSMAPEEYVCTACPPGYDGAHCERCSNGYYGNPLNIGDFCKPCDCSGNADNAAPRICDHITGTGTVVG
jgi:laminin alpha 1/2